VCACGAAITPVRLRLHDRDQGALAQLQRKVATEVLKKALVGDDKD